MIANRTMPPPDAVSLFVCFWQEQDEWYKREQELLGRIDDVKEANLKVLQMERVSTSTTK